MSGHSPDSHDPASALQVLLSSPPVLTLAAAESVTCGLVQAAIGAVSGASRYFLGGITTYTLAGKVRHLGVDAVEAGHTNGVSAPVAVEMALGVCRLFRSDLGISTTGYAEADPGRGYPQPGAFWAIARGATGERLSVVRQGFTEGPGLGRVAFQQAVTEAVLGALEEYVRMFRAAEGRSRFS